MIYLKFALKRVRCFYLILALLCAVLVYFASFGADARLPGAGVCNLDDSVQSGRVLEHLLDNGFVLCDSEAQLRSMVAEGELDCGAILPAGLGDAIVSGSTEGLVRFVESPVSFAPELYKYHVAAAIFRETAPYISAQAFEGSVVSTEKVLSTYETYFENGYAFSFEVESVEGLGRAEDIRSRNLVTGCAALLLFLLLVSGAAGLLDKDFAHLQQRIGRSRSLRLVVLPGLGVRLLAALLPMSLAVLAAGEAELIPALWIFGLLMTDVALLFSAILPGRRSLALLLPLLLTASLALCPLFIDTAALFPALKGLRWLLPPWWLWPLQERPVIWLLAGLGGLPIGLLLLYLRGKFRNFLT